MIRMRLSQAAAIVGGVQGGGDPVFSGCTLDSRRVTGGELFVALQGTRVDGHDYVHSAQREGAAAVLGERLPASHAALPWVRVEDARSAMAHLAGAWRAHCSDTVVAVITGSNGKTTVKNMLASILGAEALATQGNYNNELGVPLTLLRLAPEHRHAVLEIGASAPGDIAPLAALAAPWTALVTQCAPAHLQGFGSVDAVAQEKAEVYRALPPEGVAVLNMDDAHAEYWRREARHVRRVVGYGIEARAAEVTAVDIHQEALAGQVRFTLRLPGAEAAVCLQVPGYHQVMNALAAATLAHVLGVDAEAIVRGLQQCSATPGRLHLQIGACGCRVLDDTYNANPGSLYAALKLLGEYPSVRHLVLGDMSELGMDAEDWHRKALEQALAMGVESVWTLGPLTAACVHVCADRAHAYLNRADLMRDLAAALTPGDTVLVKGSRAMEMEEIVAALLPRMQDAAGGARNAGVSH